jgi:small-conductance mechanosensitive channel
MKELAGYTMEKIYEILNTVVLGNTILAYLISLGIFLILLLIVLIFHKLFVKRLKKLAAKTETVLDDTMIKLMKKNFLPLLYFGSFYLSVLNLEYIAIIGRILNIMGIGLLAILLIRFSITIIRYILKNYFIEKEEDPGKAATIKALFPIINILLWSIGIIFLLDNMGFNITAVVTGLGIGGIAIALAAQSVLGDLFSYFCILFDRPFVIGDFIIIRDFLGVVEHIGIKTTRIRSLSGEILVFSNTDLTGTPIRNFKHMKKRRVVFKFGVTYETSNGQLEKIPGIVKEIIEENELAAFDRAHFNHFGDFSLDYEVVYYIDTPDYNMYMDIQQNINLHLKKRLAGLGVEFAYPTQTLYVDKMGNDGVT